MGMNARGSTEVIVATIGLSMGVLSQNLFTMIVAMAVITTIAMPPTLRWALARLPLRKRGEAAARTRGLRAQRLRAEPRAHPARGRSTAQTAFACAARGSARRLARHAGDGPRRRAGERESAGKPRRKPPRASERSGPSKPADPKRERGRETVKRRRQGGERRASATCRRSTSSRASTTPRPPRRSPQRRAAATTCSSSASSRRDGQARRLPDHVSKLVEPVRRLDRDRRWRAARTTSDPAAPIDKILVPVTGNENARRGAEVAMTLAQVLQRGSLGALDHREGREEQAAASARDARQ